MLWEEVSIRIHDTSPEGRTNHSPTGSLVEPHRARVERAQLYRARSASTEDNQATRSFFYLSK